MQARELRAPALEQPVEGVGVDEVRIAVGDRRDPDQRLQLGDDPVGGFSHGPNLVRVGHIQQHLADGAVLDRGVRLGRPVERVVVHRQAVLLADPERAVRRGPR